MILSDLDLWTHVKNERIIHSVKLSSSVERPYKGIKGQRGVRPPSSD
ncbi:MAG: hypothetical protein RMI88_05870 [Nitrososphaerota archaeon]|nr:hypothetical protein [Nitrososphaerota archaeon]